MPQITKNKKALHNFEVLEKFESGIVLSGQEVKSVKQGHINLDGSYVRIKNDEAWLVNAQIPKYARAGALPEYDPRQSRKLLLRRQEIRYLTGKTQEKGLTLIPVSVYTKRTKIKLEIGLARGKKMHDKRNTIKKRDDDRRIARAMKSRR
jgi:SsrA-binding protein